MDSDESFYTRYLDETCGAFTISIDGDEWVVDSPPPIIGEVLDSGADTLDTLEFLVASLDDDEFDDLLDVLSDRPHSHTGSVVEAMRWHWALINPPRDGGFARVVSELHRYGDAIEWDLIREGIDLAQWFTDPDRHTWDKFMRFLSKLPAGGHYTAALAMDVELAEAVAAQREKDKADGKPEPAAPRPSLIGWDPAAADRAQMKDSLRRLEHAIWGASPKFKGRGGKPPQAGPRPRTAAEMVDARRRRIEHNEIAGAMLGKRFTPR